MRSISMAFYANVLLGCLLLSSGSTFASSWPIFSIPTAQQIRSLLQNNHCPAGKAMIAPGAKLEIVNRYIYHPPWYWVYTGNAQCQAKIAPINYRSYQQTSHFYPGKIIINYGDDHKHYKDDHNTYYQFTFYIPKDHWDCGIMQMANHSLQIACAQDVK